MFLKFVSRAACASLVFLFAHTLAAQTVPQASFSGVPPAPLTSARNWVLLDVTSNQVLSKHDDEVKIEPASLTKLMTAYLSFAALAEKRLSLTQTVTLPRDILKRVSIAESRMFITPALPVTFEELLKGLIIQSGNDAAVALAEIVGGSESQFVDMMNREAKRMGLNNTQFRNPSGMPDAQHYSTAQDLAKLAQKLISDFPQFYPFYAQKEFTYNKITQPNRNRLLWVDPTVDGLKTGHTQGAGFCLIASAKRGERRLLSVVLGTPNEASRAEESQRLLNWGFMNFEAVKLYDAGQALANPRVWKGKDSSVKIGFAKEFWATVPKGQAARVKPVLSFQEPLTAPIAEGTKLGSLKLMLDEKLITEVRVNALAEVKEASWLGRMVDSARLWFK